MHRFKNFIKSNFIIILVLVLASALRFYHIDYQSAWLDEICSMIEANPTLAWSDLENSIINSDPHPPLYFAFLKGFLQIFGYTTLVGRMLSAVTGILGVFSVYLLGKELLNKKVGLIASFLLAINFFHIFYSQEIRMYAQLLLFSTLSYYFLLLFLKNKTWKNAIFYGVATGLMLLTQFFGLFVLLSQLFILFVIFLQLPKSEKLFFAYKSILSGAIMMVLFIPAINIFIATTKKSYAIMQPVTVELIKQIFKDFAENSDVLLWLSIVSIALYFYLAIRKKELGKKQESLRLWILGSWIIITLAVPILRSILVTPMIVSRYFIVILPPILILIAMGIAKLPKKIAITTLTIFVIATFYQSIFLNNYYININKTQFREVAGYVNSYNEENDPIITNLPWHTTFFFKTEKVNTPILEKSFDGYVQDLIKNPIGIESFWYFGAFNNPPILSKPSQQFIDEKFQLVHNTVANDSWARHYIPKKGVDLNLYDNQGPTIVLSNISDEYWEGGVSTKFPMLLADFSEQNMNTLTKVKRLMRKGGKHYRIMKVERMGNYIHIHLDRNPYTDREVFKYPSAIEFN